MKYLKVFENQAEESAWKESEEYIKTSLSMDKENMDEVSYNSKVKFRAEYNLEGLEGDVKLMNCGNIFDSLKVNGAEAVTGTVEATREEVKCGEQGNKVVKEVIITSASIGTNGNGNAVGLDENMWFSTQPTSEFTVQLMDGGDINEYSFAFCVKTPEGVMSPQFEIAFSAFTCINENEKIYYFDAKLKLDDIDDENHGELFLYYTYLYGNMYGYPWTIISDKSIKLRDIINEGDINVKEFTITSSDFSSYDGSSSGGTLSAGSLYMSNTEKSLNNFYKEYIISTDVIDENTGFYLQAYHMELMGGLLVDCGTLEDSPMIKVTDNSYKLNDVYKQYVLLGVQMSVGFVDLSKVATNDNGDKILTDPSAIKNTNVIIKESVYDDKPLYVINQDNVNDLLGNNISAFCKLDYNRGYWLALLEINEDGSYTNAYHALTQDALSEGDGVHTFTTSGINEISNILNSTTSWVVLPTYATSLFETAGNVDVDLELMTQIIGYPYSIIQENISGGAPKELSVDASVGKVSLIGEVNDYFSTLPSNGFEGCSLETVIIPDNIKSIGTKCFGHCDRLKKVYLPQNMDKLADYAFGGNSVKRGNVVNVRRVKDESPLAFGDYEGLVTPELYEWVDLGLPSGLKWAAWNVGATKPEEFGLYFAWGETQGYTGITDQKGYLWEDYKWSSDAESTAMTKYNATDGLTTLEAVDDAATATDSSCRMPTKEDVEELKANTTSAWTQVNGVNGVSLTSKVNGNSIFLPAAGRCSGYMHIEANKYGAYFSSSLHDEMTYSAFDIYLGSTGYGVGDGLRYEGYPVRPVKE
jgi:hypothetical protein